MDGKEITVGKIKTTPITIKASEPGMSDIYISSKGVSVVGGKVENI